MKIAIIGGFRGLGFELAKAYVSDPRLHVTIIDDLSDLDDYLVQRIAYLKTIGQFDHLVKLPESLLDFHKVVDTSLPKRVHFNKFTMSDMDPGWLFNHVESILKCGVHELLLIGDGSYAKSFERFDAYGMLRVKGVVVDNVFGCSFSTKCDLFNIMLKHVDHKPMIDEDIVTDFIYDIVTSNKFVDAITSILFPEEFLSLRTLMISESTRVVYNTYYITSNTRRSVSSILALMHNAMVYVNPDTDIKFHRLPSHVPIGNAYKQSDVYRGKDRTRLIIIDEPLECVHKAIIRMAYMVDNYTKLNNSQV